MVINIAYPKCIVFIKTTAVCGHAPSLTAGSIRSKCPVQVCQFYLLHHILPVAFLCLDIQIITIVLQLPKV